MAQGQFDSCLEAALEYADRGWRVIPVWWPNGDGTCACGDAECPRPGKHPLTPSGLRDGSVNHEVIRLWWERWPEANVAIVMGEASGVVALDVDGEDGRESFDAIVARQGDYPAELVQRSGREDGGIHILVRWPGFRVAPAVGVAAGLDVRGDGSYIVAAPSLHKSGGRYEWVAYGDVPDCPRWFANAIAPRHSETGAAGPTEPLPEVVEWGRQNNTLTSLAGTLRRRGLGYEEILAALRATNAARFRPPLPDEEVEAVARSVMRYDAGPREEDGGEPARATDMGNALRFARLNRPDMRFNFARGSWLVWDGRRWAWDETGEAMRRARDVVRGIYVEAGNAQEQGVREALGAWAVRSEAAARLTAMEQLARSEPGMQVTVDELDAQDFLLNAQNCTIDLRDGSARGHDRADHLTKMAGVPWDEAAECPLWEEFLDQTFGGSADLVGFVRRMVGYCMTGSTREQKLFLLYGTGANGKSTFLDVLRAVLGDYGATASMDSFLAKSGQSSGANNDVARLAGARMVAASEIEAGRRLSESAVKELTGGDKVVARFLHQEYFEFTPKFKLLLVANHRPMVRGQDEGLWRRIRLVPFERTVPVERRDHGLGERLRAEAPGILRWAVRGCLEWQGAGLGEPAEVIAATEGYRDDMDVIGAFVGERCVVAAGTQVPTSELYREYQEWAASNGERPMSQTMFSTRVAERRFEKAHSRTGNVWKGLGLKSGRRQEVEY